VRKIEGETVVEAIRQLVEKKLEQYLAPSKIFVYSGSVEQNIEIREALECLIYHHSVDD
jgi:hypothetical protein